MAKIYREVVAAAFVAGLLGFAPDSSTAAEQAPKAQSGLQGDSERGEQLYGRCKACHSLVQDRVGPRHCGLLGRPAGAVSGFPYSAAMSNADLIWTETNLDAFLADPRGIVPGTTMTYAGIDDPAVRADLIAFLRTASEDPALCPD